MWAEVSSWKMLRRDQAQQVYFYYVNKNYFDFLNIDFLAGKGFVSDQLNNDTNTEIIINDAARIAFGFNSPEDALGKLLYQNKDIVGRIHGVVKTITINLSIILSRRPFINTQKAKDTIWLKLMRLH